MRNTNLPSFAVFCVHLIKLLHLCLILLHDLCTLLDWFSFILYIGLGSFGLQSFWISFAKLWILALKEKKNLQWMFESRFKIYILLQFLWNLLLPLGNKEKNPPTYLGWVESFFKPFLIFAASFFSPFYSWFGTLALSPWGQKVGTVCVWSFVPSEHSSPEAVAALPRPGCNGVFAEEGRVPELGAVVCWVWRTRVSTASVWHSWRELGFLWGWGRQRLAVHTPCSAKGVSVKVRPVTSPLPS